MSVERETSADRQSRIDLALQVANLAALVSAALKSGDATRRTELEGRLALVQERLQQTGAPTGLIPFIEVLRGALSGVDMSELAEELPRAYRAVYDQLMDEQEAEDEGQLTVREVMEEVSRNVVAAMRRGSADHRRRMANTLLQMAQESEKRPDLTALIDFLMASRLLLLDRDPSTVVDRLVGSFRDQWQRIVDAIEG